MALTQALHQCINGVLTVLNCDLFGVGAVAFVAMVEVFFGTNAFQFFNLVFLPMELRKCCRCVTFVAKRLLSMGSSSTLHLRKLKYFSTFSFIGSQGEILPCSEQK